MTLPSGVFLSTPDFQALRRADDAQALHLLDQLIESWQLPPHDAVPDTLAAEPLQLPSGRVVNAAQWRIVRSGSDTQAGAALDVVLRSVEAQAS